MAYIETRFYDNEIIKVKFHKGSDYPKIEESDEFDSYVDLIENVTLKKWFNYLKIKTEEMNALIISLEEGKWVDITNYCKWERVFNLLENSLK